MVDENIKNYIIDNKDKYSKEEINIQLKSTGASEDQIDECWNEILNPTLKSNKKNKNKLLLISLIVTILVMSLGIYYFYINSNLNNEILFYEYSEETKLYSLSDNIPQKINEYTLMEADHEIYTVREENGIIKILLRYEKGSGLNRKITKIDLQQFTNQDVIEKFKNDNSKEKLFFITYNNKKYILDFKNKKMIWISGENNLVSIDYTPEEIINKEYFNEIFKKVEEKLSNNNKLTSSLDLEEYENTEFYKIPIINSYKITSANFQDFGDAYAFKEISYQNKQNLIDWETVSIQKNSESRTNSEISGLVSPNNKDNLFNYNYNKNNIIYSNFEEYNSEEELYWISNNLRITFKIDSKEDLLNNYKNEILDKYLLIFPVDSKVKTEILKLTKYEDNTNNIEAEVEEQSNFGSSILITKIESNGNVHVQNDWKEEVLVNSVKITQNLITCELSSYNLIKESLNTIKTSCDQNLDVGSSAEALIITDSGIFSQTLTVK